MGVGILPPPYPPCSGTCLKQVGTIDYKTSDAVTLNGKYEAGPRKYQLGGTWNGTVSDRSTSLKVRQKSGDGTGPCALRAWRARARLQLLC